MAQVHAHIAYATQCVARTVLRGQKIQGGGCASPRACLLDVNPNDSTFQTTPQAMGMPCTNRANTSCGPRKAWRANSVPSSISTSSGTENLNLKSFVSIVHSVSCSASCSATPTRDGIRCVGDYSLYPFAAYTQGNPIPNAKAQTRNKRTQLSRLYSYTHVRLSERSSHVRIQKIQFTQHLVRAP